MTVKKPPGQTIETVERAADVLATFVKAEGNNLGVTEIADSLSLSKAVVHRILTTLKEKGLVQVDPETRRYSLGPASLAIGLTYLHSIEIRDLARPFLKDLSERTGETATLSIRQDDTRLYVDQVTPPREVKMTVQLGRPYPLHAGSSSRALLAHLGSDEIERILAKPLDSLTSETITDTDNLRKMLDEVVDRGYAVSLGERQEGAGSVAAPVFNHDSEPIAVVSVCGPVERFRGEINELAPLLVETTDALSRRLGWPGTISFD